MMLTKVRFIIALTLLLTAATVFAAPGERVDSVGVAVPSSTGIGIGVAVDCDAPVTMYYTNSNVDTLYSMTTSGLHLTALPLRTSTGLPISFGAITWDNVTKTLWGGTDYSGNPLSVYQIDPKTGYCTSKFSMDTIGCCGFCDGIAMDRDRTLWVSDDIANSIEHWNISGIPYLIGRIYPDSLGAPLGSISGIAVGQGDRLYLGRDGLSKITAVNKKGNFISEFATTYGRVEGLACDLTTFAHLGKEVLWAKDAYNNFVEAFEVDSGTCECSGGAPPSISLDSVSDLDQGYLPFGAPVTFNLRVTNPTNLWMSSIDNGFRVYSPGGAEWSTTGGDTTSALAKADFQEFTISSFSSDGAGADTIGFSGFAYEGGLPPGFDEVAYEITIGPIDLKYGGETICLDSTTYYPIEHMWLWSSYGQAYYPEWDGPHCFLVKECLISVTSPSGGEVFVAGNEIAVNWSSDCPCDFSIELSTDGGLNWISIANNVGNVGSYLWLVPDTPSDDCRIRICCAGTDVCGESGPFEIRGNEPPEFVNPCPDTVIERGEPYTCYVEASDPDEDPITIECLQKPPEATFVDNGDGTALFSFLPDSQHVGQQYTIVFEASDFQKSVQDTLLISVTHVNEPPEFVSTCPDTTLTEGQPYTCEVAVSDPDNDPITMTCPDKPAGATFLDNGDGTGAFSFLPDFSHAGKQYVVIFQASDLDTSIFDTLAISVLSLQLVVVSPQPQPGEGQDDLLLDDQPIEIRFNKAVADTSLDDDSNVHVTSKKGDALGHSYDSEQYALQIDNGSTYLRPFDTIVVVLDTGIVDLGGGPLDQQYILTFYTGAAVYPGDANNDHVVDERDVLPLGMYWGKEGPPRSETGDLAWGMKLAHVSESGDEWSPATAVLADADGSGVIGPLDICGITENWGQTRMGAKTSAGDSLETLAAIGQAKKSTLQQLYAAVIDCPESPGKASLIGMLEPLAGDDNVEVLPTSVELYQNYPNPFNPSTVIKFYLPHSGHVTLTIYDIMGRSVAVLYDGQMAQGYREFVWEGTDETGARVSSGIYFYRLETAEGNFTRRMMLLK